MSTSNLLLVEDDPNDILMMGRALSHSGLDVGLSVVRDGDEAIRFLERATGADDVRREPLPSLVLLDLKLPKRGGIEVLQWIRRQAPLRRMPVVVLTSAWNDADVECAYDAGANSFLVKPVGFEQLVETVKTLKRYWFDLNQNARQGRV